MTDTTFQGGQTVYVARYEHIMSQGLVTVSNTSGGVTLVSGRSSAVILTNISGNTPMYVGAGTGSDYGLKANSGIGLVLYGGQQATLNVSNPNTIAAYATTNGQLLSYLVTVG